MRRKLLLVCLLVCLCSVNGSDVRKEDEDKDKKRQEKDEIIYEPCDYSDDVDCVRKFFKAYGACSVIHHDDDKPVFIHKRVAYVPLLNLTVIMTKVRLAKLNGKIETFYINKKTNNLVISVNFEGVEGEFKETYYVINRKGREPVVATDYTNVTIPITLTAVIPLVDGYISIKEATITSFFDNPAVQYYIGPKVTASEDPDVSAFIASIPSNLSAAVPEYCLTEGPIYFLAYLQKYICKYGISLES